MKKKIYFILALTVLAGSNFAYWKFNGQSPPFASESDSPVWEPSPVFEMNGEKVIGEPSKVGISTIPLVAGERQRVDWLLWGKQSDLFGSEFELIARAKGAEPETIIENRAIAYPENIANARVPALISVPHSGLWKFEAYLDGDLYGSVVIEVINKKN